MLLAGFEKIAENVWRVPVPFPGCWAGVALVTGKENILIDTGGCAETVDSCIVPALKELGMTLKDISWMALTHIHGDHVGGMHRIKQLAPWIRVACFRASAERVRAPRAYSAEIRAKFPGHSAPVPDVLEGFEPDRLLDDGETLGDITLMHTPGHDTDACSYFDARSRTLFTGDSLQLNGTVSQGCALLMDVPGYGRTLEKLRVTDIEHIACGHPYLPLGADAHGRAEVKAFFDACAACYAHDIGFVRGMAAAGVTDAAEIARALISEVGGSEPKFLFLPMHTVTGMMNMALPDAER